MRPKAARTTKPFTMVHKPWWEVPVGTYATGLTEYGSRPGVWHGICMSPMYDSPDSPKEVTVFVAHADCLAFEPELVAS